ncbi:MAG: nucleotidyltransferase family protein [Rhodocyclales bacterium]|nr:nucleotidyltransferase family protein [Rhodocyclales bacterium]
MNPITGLLLAAGSSRRFGSDKRWHRFADGTPMALQAARRLLAACPRSVAVVRANDVELAGLLTAAGLRCVVAEHADNGMGHSLARGVAATAAASGWLVALADMPFIAPASYAAVLGALADGARIARPVFDGRSGHPVGFAAAFRDDLLALAGDQGGKVIIDRDPAALCRCPVDDPGVLHDIDRLDPARPVSGGD